MKQARVNKESKLWMTCKIPHYKLKSSTRCFDVLHENLNFITIRYRGANIIVPRGCFFIAEETFSRLGLLEALADKFINNLAK